MKYNSIRQYIKDRANKAKIKNILNIQMVRQIKRLLLVTVINPKLGHMTQMIWGK